RDALASGILPGLHPGTDRLLMGRHPRLRTGAPMAAVRPARAAGDARGLSAASPASLPARSNLAFPPLASGLDRTHCARRPAGHPRADGAAVPALLGAGPG